MRDISICGIFVFFSSLRSNTLPVCDSWSRTVGQVQTRTGGQEVQQVASGKLEQAGEQNLSWPRRNQEEASQSCGLAVVASTCMAVVEGVCGLASLPSFSSIFNRKTFQSDDQAVTV